MTPLPLSEFVVQVPGFLQQDSLASLVKILIRGDYDCGVVVTPQGIPLGVIRAHRVVRYLLRESLFPLGQAFSSEFSEFERETERSQFAYSQPDCSSALTALTAIGDYPELLEPVWLISADQSPDHFWAHMAAMLAIDSTVGVLVDGQSLYLGVLAADKVLHFLTTGQRMSQRPVNRPDSSSRVWPTETTNLSLELQAETRLEPVQATLAAVLEQLPLAFMLQTGTGQVLFRNRTWLTLEPVFPTSSDWTPLDTSIFSTSLDPLRGASSTDQASVNVNTAVESSLQMACIPATPDLPIQDEVWQFVRLPLSRSALLGSSGELFSEGPWHCLTPSFRLQDLQFCSGGTLTCEVSGPDFWLVLALPPTPKIQQTAAAIASLPKSAWLLELSHELKSPLTSLLGLSTLLQDPRLGSLNPRQSRYARLVQQTARQLIATFNQLLDWFRLDTGQLVLVPAVVNLEELGPQVLRSLKFPADPDGAAPTPESRFSWTVEPGAPTLVADPLRLRQMLHYLVNNALTHTDAQVPCGLHVEQWGTWFALTVWDRGVGLPPHQQAHLLQSYYEPGADQQTPRGSVGLGLLLTWHLVRLHGGDLTFASSPQGSQFTLLLPPQPSEGWLDENLPLNVPMSAKTTLLLLACSEGEVIELVVKALAATDYRVAIARSPAETLDKAQRLKPDLILMHRESFSTQAMSLTPTLATTLPVLGLGLAQPSSAIADSLQGWLPISQITNQLAPLLSHLLPTLPQDGPMLASALEKLTILYLTEVGHPQDHPTQLHRWLHQYHCRVLEVDDLAQADLLVRVWKPQVVLLDEAIANPHLCFQKLTQYANLSACPLVVLTADLVEAANPFPQLLVFPCLSAPTLSPNQAMLQLMQVLVEASKSAN
ncbi:MAG TPA: ATP-binding protein [Leptolyngbyaceae cyanobacterium]